MVFVSLIRSIGGIDPIDARKEALTLQNRFCYEDRIIVWRLGSLFTDHDMTRQFLLDVMLGKLATYLRMCGYDNTYVLDAGLEADDEISEYAARSDRNLVTRDQQLANRTAGAILL